MNLTDDRTSNINETFNNHLQMEWEVSCTRNNSAPESERRLTVQEVSPSDKANRYQVEEEGKAPGKNKLYNACSCSASTFKSCICTTKFASQVIVVDDQ